MTIVVRHSSEHILFALLSKVYGIMQEAQKNKRQREKTETTKTKKYEDLYASKCHQLTINFVRRRERQVSDIEL